MSIPRIVEFFWPLARNLVNFRIDDDGTGPRVALWDAVAIGAAQPTIAEILEHEADFLASGGTAAAKARARSLREPVGVRLTADRSTTNNAYQDCVGLSFQLAANAHYTFSFDGAYNTAAAAGTGIQLALNGPAFSFFGAVFSLFTGTTTVLGAARVNYNVGVDGTGSAGATALPFRITGNVSTTAAGLLIVRFRSEINGSQVTIQRGSQGQLIPVQ